EVHALLELAEPALHIVERLRETRNIGLGGILPGALVGASDQPPHHDLRACDHADDERGADGPARNHPHAPPPARLLRGKEAPVGIEPTNRGFADLCLTTWLRRQLIAATRTYVGANCYRRVRPMILSHPNDHDNRSFSSSSALPASARAPAWQRLAGPESTPESRSGLWSSPDSSPDF